MIRNLRIFTSPEELSEYFADLIAEKIRIAGQKNEIITIALSGGSTPKLLFRKIFERHGATTNWNQVRFFWGDERCVPPDNAESNFGMTHEILFSKISINEKNIHRIHGENDPDQESVRYSKEIRKVVRSVGGLPEFDIVMLGIGDDGHTASIFPGNLNLFDSENICETTLHPFTGQKRITLSGKVINNADSKFFLVTGKGKGQIIRQIINKEEGYLDFPASHVIPGHGTLEWLLDENAASLLR